MDLIIHTKCRFLQPVFKKQTLKIMRLTAIFLLAACMQASAKDGSGQITLSEQNAPFSRVMEKIQAQSGYDFVSTYETLKEAGTVTVKVKNVSLQKALEECLKEKPLTYVIIGKTVVIKTQRKILDSDKEIEMNVSQLLPPPVEIKGRVTDENGKPLAGVSVTLKGNITVGTTTSSDGSYSLSVPNSNSTLVFSFVGYQPEERSIGNQTVINVSLVTESKSLDQVVVTALGIKRSAKSLGYATTTVNVDELNESKNSNFASGLQGKVSGLDVTTPPSGPGGSVKIRIRGQASFTGDNSPLIIVNGIPMDNSLDGGSNGEGPAGANNVDEGDGLQSLNPDDISSITVLKGAAAAALYGHRAKSGALIITTKDGAGSKGIGIEVSSSFQLSQALDYTDFQYEYGQGESGKRPTSVANARSSGTWSFGEKFDGRLTPQIDGLEHPYVPVRSRVPDFFDVGRDWSQTVALTGGNEKGNFRFSFSNLDANSIVPNSAFHRKTFNLGLNHNFTNKLSMQMNANYSHDYNKNPPVVGQQASNISTTLYTIANSIDIRWMKDNYQDENGNEIGISRFTPRTDPYWIINKDFYNVRKDRLIGNLSLKYQFTDWLYLQGRVGQDYYTHPVDFNIATGAAYLAPAPVGFNGTFYQALTTFRELNTDFLIGINKSFGNIGIDVNLGGNQMRQDFEEEGNRVQNFYVRDLYSIGNGINKFPVNNFSRRRVNSLYGAAEVSVKQLLFLTVTGRNDWYSTLNPKSNSFFYPSGSLSFVFSELMGGTPDWLNYGKLRGSYAEVGGDTDPYSDRIYYTINPSQFNGVPLGSINTNTSPNPNLRPLSVREAEVGIELGLFKNRMQFELSVYKKNSVDEIVNVDVSNSSGYSQTKINVGRLRNSGVSSNISYDIFRGQKFHWTTSFNWSYNESKVLSLAEGQQRLDVGTGEFFGTISHEVGKPLASLRGFDYKRDNQGRILTSGGRFQQGNIVTFGSALPKWVGGWINSFGAFGFNVFAQVDFKFGHKLISNSNMNFVRHGLSKFSLPGREGGVIMDAVDKDGHPNTTAVEAEDFYTVYRSTSIATPFIYDAGFIRWRTLSVGYDLTRFVKSSFLKRGLSVSAVINNVWLISKHVDNLDPESQYSISDNLSGIELHALPTTRSYGISLNVKF